VAVLTPVARRHRFRFSLSPRIGEPHTMSQALELSVILSTYERPRHLERSLASLAIQQGVQGRFEVVVADDGSQDETHAIVQRFAQSVDFPIQLATHPHDGFRLAFCRNEGVRASRGSYLLFTDSDCIFPPDHLQKHLLARRPGLVRTGNAYRLKRALSERIDRASIVSGEYLHWVPRYLQRRMFRRWLNDRYYEIVRHPTKPKLSGCDCGIWRCDFEAVNGFDEDFRGWGCEDDDLGLRLRGAGLRIATIVRYTRVCHLWHPFDPTHPGSWRNGRNVSRLAEPRPVRCVNGLFPPVLGPEESTRTLPTRMLAKRHKVAAPDAA
jgi:glycosyltransferase involved in cell wall biosynthesis